MTCAACDSKCDALAHRLGLFDLEDETKSALAASSCSAIDREAVRVKGDPASKKSGPYIRIREYPKYGKAELRDAMELRERGYFELPVENFESCHLPSLKKEGE